MTPKRIASLARPLVASSPGCWGLEGMLLAVPLTVVLRIVLDNRAVTRPVARLMGVA